MQVSCPQCSRDLEYRELDDHTVYRSGEFVTSYRCPYCEAELDGFEAD